ncbi:MAG TPA: FliH/SctL family protein [Candidatus Sulfotelmatobacter sp.]|nr:FliH/SctL family protein [Candidatus Sulfotelmatobacter sp.]
MPSSDEIGALSLPTLGRSAEADGEVADDGRWSPPAWQSRAVLPPPDRDAESYARGYQDGVREGERIAAEDVRPVLQALQRAAERLERIEGVFASERSDAVRVLALAVARRILAEELALKPERVIALVERAISMLPNEAPIEVRLHPDDLKVLKESGPLAPGGAATHVEWAPDPTLPRGDCRVESHARLVDGRLDVVLRQWCERLIHD